MMLTVMIVTLWDKTSGDLYLYLTRTTYKVRLVISRTITGAREREGEREEGKGRGRMCTVPQES